MEKKFSEGAGRPLYESAPLSCAMPPRAFTAAALLSYPPAYLYVRDVLFNEGPGWGMPLFAAVFVLCVEAFARACRRQGSGESVLWALGWLALSVFVPLYGVQGGALTTYQLLAWHLMAIWYVLARCGMLAAGHSGLLLPLDGVTGLVLPWGQLFLRVRVLWRALRASAANGVRHASQTRRQRLAAAGSVLAALALGAYAWSQLAAADPRFAMLGGWVRLLGRLLGTLTEGWWPLYLLFSLPVGAWLYGLVAGSLQRAEPPCTAQRFFAWLEPWQKLPALAASLTLGVLCGIYGAFFLSQAVTFVQTVLPHGALGVVRASRYAVDGFWEMCRVQLLDLALLAVLRLWGPGLLRRRGIRRLQATFCTFGVAFAALGCAKIGLYIARYAFTPRRVIAGWFAAVLLAWAVLALLWALGHAPRMGCARLAVALFVAAFLALSAVDMDRQIIRANIDRYAAGQDAQLGTDVLSQCGVGDWSWQGEQQDQALYARWLLEAGWFIGRDTAQIGRLYLLEESALAQGNGTVEVDLGHGAALQLQFEAGACTAAQLLENGD